jgi:hypothetical protein
MSPADDSRARDAIRDVVARYCRGVDRLLPDLVVAGFHNAAQLDYGFFAGGPRDFADTVLPMLERTYAHTAHCMLNHLCVVSGAAAIAETYMMIAQVPRGDAAGMQSMSYCRYVDDFTCVDGRWAIARRTCAVDMIGSVPFAPWAGATEASTLIRGTRDAADASRRAHGADAQLRL